MPKGTKARSAPTDVIGNAIIMAKIATGEITRETGQDGKGKAAAEKAAGRTSLRGSGRKRLRSLISG